MLKVLRRIYGIAMALFMQVVFLYPWIPNGSGKITSLEYAKMLYEAKDMQALLMKTVSQFASGGTASLVDYGSELSSESMASVALLVTTVCLCAAQALCLIYILFSLFGKGTKLCIVALVACCGSLMTAQELMGLSREAAIYVLVTTGVVLLTVVGCSFLETVGEDNRSYREAKRRKKELKKEMKVRLRFPGRYGTLFYRVIAADSRYRWKDYVIFIVTASIAVGVIFAGFGMFTMLSGTGLGTTLLSFLIISVAVSLFLLVNVLLFYLRSREGSYGQLLSQGMRRRALHIYMATELIICIVLSLILGSLVGYGLLSGCKSFLVKQLGAGVIAGDITLKTWGYSLIGVAVLFLLSFLLTNEQNYSAETRGVADKAVTAERVGSSHNVLSFIVGAALCGGAGYLFLKRTMVESVVLVTAFTIGLYFLIKPLWGLVLWVKGRSPAMFYRGFLTKNHQYYRFQTMFRYMFFLTAIHICVLFVFAKNIAADSVAEYPKALFPYDYMCMATKNDGKFFKNLEKKYGVERLTYPMQRVSTLDKSSAPDNFLEVMEQGQHIGISRTTYEKLCEQAGVAPAEFTLAGDGSEVYVVYQQDRSKRAHPLDYYMSEETPHLRVGQPIDYSTAEKDSRDTLFPERTVVGEETRILTGAFLNGEQENLVVFSDEYMKSLKNAWKTTDYLTEGSVTGGTEEEPIEAVEGETVHRWPDRLVLLKVSGESRADVEKALKKFQKNHALDEQFDSDIKAYYSKADTVSRISEERAMEITVATLIIALLIVAAWVMLFIKTEAEMKERKKQQGLLALVGMRPRARRRMILSEFWGYVLVPFIGGGAASFGFLWVSLKLRGFAAAERNAFFTVWGKVGGIYAVIMVLAGFCLALYTIRRVEKE